MKHELVKHELDNWSNCLQAVHDITFMHVDFPTSVWCLSNTTQACNLLWDLVVVLLRCYVIEAALLRNHT